MGRGWSGYEDAWSTPHKAMSDKYIELDRVQAELQIMSCLVSRPIDMQDQLVSYAEDVAALLRSEGVWATHSSSIYSSQERCLIVDVARTIGSARVFITARRILSMDIYGIKHIGTPYYTHNSHRELVLHLRGITRRRMQWEATLKRCGSCLYSNSEDNPNYCGAGLTFDVGCTSYEVRT